MAPREIITCLCWLKSLPGSNDKAFMVTIILSIGLSCCLVPRTHGPPKSQYLRSLYSSPRWIFQMNRPNLGRDMQRRTYIPTMAYHLHCGALLPFISLGQSRRIQLGRSRSSCWTLWRLGFLYETQICHPCDLPQSSHYLLCTFLSLFPSGL